MIYKIKTFGFEKLSNIFDGFMFLLGIPAIKPSKWENVILFVGEHLPPRIPRLAKWIKRKSDYRIILVCHQRGYVEQFSDPCFDQVLLFRNAYHLKRILKNTNNVQLIHGFAPKSHFPNIARKFLQKPYVHDMQDVYTIYYPEGTELRWLKNELPHEQECLTEADGIIACSMEINAALKLLKPKNKPKTIFFPLYCDDDFFQENAKTLKENEIHLVYAGGVAGRFRSPAQYGNIQFHDMIELITKQQIHFHIYPSPSNIRADYEEYELLENGNPFFHFHKPIPQQELAKELNKYHFGILPFFKSLSKQSDLKINYATTLKLFNYLEAGIPVIVSEDIAYQNWILNRYGAAINVNLESIKNLRQKIMETDYEKFKMDISKNREKLSLKNNITRLDEFYKSL